MVTRSELRAKLAAIGQRLAAVHLEAKPTQDECDAKLKPFLDRERALEEEKELLLEASGMEVIGPCEGCGTLILEGDRHTWVNDEVMYFCVECSPSWKDSLHSAQERLQDPYIDDDEREHLTHCVEVAKDHIEGGRGDEKVY